MAESSGAALAAWKKVLSLLNYAGRLSQFGKQLDPLFPSDGNYVYIIDEHMQATVQAERDRCIALIKACVGAEEKCYEQLLNDLNMAPQEDKGTDMPKPDECSPSETEVQRLDRRIDDEREQPRMHRVQLSDRIAKCVQQAEECDANVAGKLKDINKRIDCLRKDTKYRDDCLQDQAIKNRNDFNGRLDDHNDRIFELAIKIIKLDELMLTKGENDLGLYSRVTKAEKRLDDLESKPAEGGEIGRDIDVLCDIYKRIGQLLHGQPPRPKLDEVKAYVRDRLGANDV